jgi:hypothetical protein
MVRPAGPETAGPQGRPRRMREIMASFSLAPGSAFERGNSVLGAA